MHLSTDTKSLLAACKRNYGHSKNVLSVGFGIKYKNGKQINSYPALHFYVRKKLKRPGRPLPQYVFGRSKKGKILRGVRIETDVIELKNLQFACKAGTEIEVIGERGTITLLFRNKSLNSNDFYLLTCAHVAGTVDQSPPSDPTVRSSCCSFSPLANTVANSTEKAGVVDYDIALARLNSACEPQPDCEIIGESIPVSRFLNAEEIRPGQTVECVFPVSNISTANIASYRTDLPLILDHREYIVKNLFLIDRPPRPGDSGGLLYADNAAVGILVGLSDGWGLFQPIGEAFAHLKKLVDFEIECF